LLETLNWLLWLVFNVTATQISHLWRAAQKEKPAQEVSERENNAHILVTRLPRIHYKIQTGMQQLQYQSADTYAQLFSSLHYQHQAGPTPSAAC